MSPLEPEVPPAGEEIHLPAPSVMPILLAFGASLALVGVTVSIVLVVIGLAIAIPVAARWLISTLREIDELPPQ